MEIASMYQERLKLVAPTVELRDEFVRFCKELAEAGQINGVVSMDYLDFDNSLQASREHARGVNLPDGWVRSETSWLVRNERTILGTINLRWSLTKFLEAEGGHVGYATRPSERRRGYAISMLRACLEIARSSGLTRVLITCDGKNAASARVIEKAGGRLENEVPSRTPGRETTRRYWIELPANS